MKRLFARKEIFYQIILLILVSGTIYLPRIGQLQYYKDDWYYVLDGLYGSPAIFNEMFAIDRPARGPIFQVYFSLFGANPLPYHLGHYFWRLSAAVAALWLFRMLWPRQNRLAFFAALFFLVYPGYLWWISGIEYQPMVVSLFLQVLSIALTVKALLIPGLSKKIIYLLGSILTGWEYLALVDYAFGMEFFRLGLILVIVSRRENVSLFKQGLRTVKIWFFSSSIIPVGFLFWKVFLFAGERKVTDLSAQLAPFFDAPRQVLKLWFVGLVRDGLTVSVLAWIEPFSQSFWSLSLNEIIIGLLFATMLIGFMYAASHFLNVEPIEYGNHEPILIGLLSCFIGVVPIVIANRYVDFGFFSHYSLPASLAAALFLAGLVAFITPGKMQFSFVSLVVAAAALTHYATALFVVREINIINTFWWQAYWRAPGIREGTTLIVDYPVLGFDDQVDNVWGPANLLYYPDDKQQQIPVEYKLAALPLSGSELEIVFSKGEQRTGYRTHFFRYYKDQVLVLSQPVEGACVRILDGNIPVLSSQDTSEISAVAPYSRPDTLLLDASARLPLAVFGKEPEHGWCYYFEKLDLALQQGDQQKALSLANEALANCLSPKDPVEWMPVLLTYMYDGDFEMVTKIAKHIKKDENLENQVCNVFVKNRPADARLTQEMNDMVDFLFCHK